MLYPVRVALVAHPQVRPAAHLRLRSAHHKSIFRDFPCNPYHVVVCISTNNVGRRCKAHLHERAKSQTFDATRDRWLEDSAFLLEGYISPVFCAPLKDIDGTIVELDGGFYTVSQRIVNKCPNHPPSS
jgi:hypothetical protein